MRKLLISAGLSLATLAAGAAIAQPAHAAGCQQSKHNDRVTGTVLGGIVGGLAGGAIGGDTAGALVGAGVGAVGGNVIAGRRAGPCPSEYYSQRSSRRYRHGPAYDRRYDNGPYRPTAYYNGGNRCGRQDQTYRDAYGNVVHRQVQVCR